MLSLVSPHMQISVHLSLETPEQEVTFHKLMCSRKITVVWKCVRRVDSMISPSADNGMA